MTAPTKGIIIILFLNSIVSLSCSFGQQKSDYEFFINNRADSLSKNNYASYTANNKNEVQLILSGLFLFYKEVFSAQDNNQCSFTPSCSEYAITTIKKKGLFIGSFDTCDRLLRCNSLSPEYYKIDPEKRLLIDPVK
jgi:uncharacterized protein